MSYSNGRNSPVIQMDDNIAASKCVIGTELLPHLNSSTTEPTTNPNRLSSQKSINSDSTALLYRYGQEIGASSLKSSFSAGTMGTGGMAMSMGQYSRLNNTAQLPFPNNNTSMFPPGMNPQTYEQFLQGQQNAMTASVGGAQGNLGINNSLTRASFTSSIGGDYDEHSLMSQMTSGNPHHSRNNSNNNKPLKVVSGSQFRLTTKGNGPCPSCDALEKTNKKSKELIRTLKLQILRMEENFKDLKYMKANNSSQPDAGLKISADNSGLVMSEDKELESRCLSLEEELAKLKKVLAYERNINENMRTNLDEAKKLHTAEMKQMSDDCLLANNRCRNMEESITQLRNSKADYELRILTLKTQLDKTQRELDETILRLKAADHQNEVSLGHARDLETLKRDLEKLESANKALSTQLRETKDTLTETTESRNHYRESSESLENKCKELEARLAAALVEAKTANDQNNATKKRFDAMETNIRVAMQERDALKTLLSGKETENFQKGLTIEALQKDIADLQNKLQEAAKKAAVEAMTNKKALEKAIAGSVRLCVVAPTVNVHVNDARHKFKSKISQTGLKSFLDTEVFEKYCFLYKQASDNAAPTGGNIEAWLQQMLAQMQLSIENHVNSAMEGSSL